MLTTRTLAFAVAGLLSASSLFAQGYTIASHVVAGGGGASNGGPYALTGTIGQPDAGPSMSGGSYTAAGGFWTTLAVVLGFTDDPITPGVTLVRALHISELRVRVDAQRVRFGLSAAIWTDPAIGVGLTIVTAQHVHELRVALVQAYQAAGVIPPEFIDGTLAAGVTPVKAVHVSELRAAVQNLEGQ